MTIWAIADLHLSISTPNKSMEAFGPVWKDYEKKIEQNWRAKVKEEDLVLVAGDISWAMHLSDALIDLQWIDQLPGTKIILRGNHDYWWPSSSKLKVSLPQSLHFIHNNAIVWNGIWFGGSRLWDTEEYSFEQYVNFVPHPFVKEKKVKQEEQEKIFVRELARLEMSLQQIPKSAKKKIALTHYPPIGNGLTPSRASQILEKYGIEKCVFGHLHSLKEGVKLFGDAGGISYTLTSADYLNFTPIRIL